MKKLILALAVGLGLIAPALVPVAASAVEPAAVEINTPASVSGCHGDASHNPEGGWVWCDSQTQTNDRYRAKIECVQKVSPYFTQARYGAAKSAAGASVASCSSGYRIIGVLEVQFCDNYVYVSSGGYWTCSSGWAYKQGWYVSTID